MVIDTEREVQSPSYQMLCLSSKTQMKQESLKGFLHSLELTISAEQFLPTRGSADGGERTKGRAHALTGKAGLTLLLQGHTLYFYCKTTSQMLTTGKARRPECDHKSGSLLNTEKLADETPSRVKLIDENQHTCLFTSRNTISSMPFLGMKRENGASKFMHSSQSSVKMQTLAFLNYRLKVTPKRKLISS